MLSLTVRGTPSSGPSASPLRQRASLARAASRAPSDVERDDRVEMRIDGFAAREDRVQHLDWRELAALDRLAPSRVALKDQSSADVLLVTACFGKSHNAPQQRNEDGGRRRPAYAGHRQMGQKGRRGLEPPPTFRHCSSGLRRQVRPASSMWPSIRDTSCRRARTRSGTKCWQAPPESAFDPAA